MFIVSGIAKGYTGPQRSHDKTGQDWYPPQVLQPETRCGFDQESPCQCTTTLGESCV